MKIFMVQSNQMLCRMRKMMQKKYPLAIIHTKSLNKLIVTLKPKLTSILLKATLNLDGSSQCLHGLSFAYYMHTRLKTQPYLSFRSQYRVKGIIIINMSYWHDASFNPSLIANCMVLSCLNILVLFSPYRKVLLLRMYWNVVWNLKARNQRWWILHFKILLRTSNSIV